MAKQIGVGDHALTMTTEQLNAVRDDLYVLECALGDVKRDNALASEDPVELREALRWLMSCAEPLVVAHSRLF
jgi:hypothetical protein